MLRHAPDGRAVSADFGSGSRGGATSRRRRRPWASLPSPVLAVLVLVFVVLPLVWPETEDATAPPPGRGAFSLGADVTSVAVSPDSLRVAATGRDRSITVWQKAEGPEWASRELPEHKPTGSRCLVVAPDGRRLAAGNVDGTISLWDMSTGANLASLKGGEEMVLAMALSPDGKRIAAAGGDGRVRVWDLDTGQPEASLDVRDRPVTSLAFGPDGRSLACGCEDGAVRIWDVGRPTAPPLTLATSPEVVLAVAFSPDGRTVAASSLCTHGVQVWNLPDGRNRGFLRTGSFTATCLGFEADGNHLLVGEDDGKLSIWNTLTLSRVTEFQAHSGWVKALALSQGSSGFVTGGNDGLVRRWDLGEILVGSIRR
ncbi:WD40 repeat domain-containing protein [Aquisphaera insulae]|uniref:WD40 repeat domain-containing protein n=1 Tax=Aquisphaera insulae TaxID=2712864 RepID=UPI0013EA8548|nr:WD40 repeat domain-containing protein [Aquisphaera insulae]